MLGNDDIFFLFNTLDNRQDNAVEVSVKKPLHFVAPHGIIGTIQYMRVGIHIIGNKNNRFFGVDEQIELLHYFNRFLFKRPFEQRIYIVKMVIEGLAIDSAIGNNFAYADFG